MDSELRVKQVIIRAISDLAKISSEAAAAMDFVGSNFANSVAVNLKQIAPLGPSTKALSIDHAKPSPASKKSAYPRFYVRENVLFKVGRSRKGKSEYVHKVPREAYELTTKTVAQAGKKKLGACAAEDVLKGLVHAGEEIPAYQVYVTLSLLNKHGALQKQGREGYLVPDDIEAQARAIWNECEAVVK